MLKRILTLMLAAMLLLPACATALETGEDLQGIYCWPEGSTPENASYIYQYIYPTVLGNSNVAEMINAHYAYLVSDAHAFAIPMAVDALGEGERVVTTVTSEVTCNTDDYFSVLITSRTDYSGIVRTVYSGNTFTLRTELAGSATNLPRLLGLLDDQETDEWLLDRQTAKANTLIYELVWKRIQKNTDIAWYEDLTLEALTWEFYPEEDFYLDAQGNPVFFLQPGSAAPFAAGWITFPLTLEEIHDDL